MLSSDNAVAQAKKATPWSAPWGVSLVEGILLTVLGIYLMRQPETAIIVFSQFLALYLFIAGLFQTIAGLREPRTTSAANFALYRGIIGAVIGGILVLALIFGWLTVETGVWLLALGLFLYGLIGLYLAFAQKTRGSGRLLALIGSISFILLGATGLFFQGHNVVDQWVGPVFTILGLLLIVFAFIRRSQLKKAAEEKAAAEKAAADKAASDKAAADKAAAGQTAASGAAAAVDTPAAAATPAASTSESGKEGN